VAREVFTKVNFANFFAFLEKNAYLDGSFDDKKTQLSSPP